jgi:hypothetical protein
MGVRVQCPSCGRPLLAQEGALGSRGTCPSCLAEIAIPEAVQTERPERRERGPSCPRCGRDVEPIWITCPWCEEPLRGREPRRYGRPDLDVRRDNGVMAAMLIVLAAIGAIGIVIMGLGAFGTLTEGQPGGLISLIVAVLFLAGLTTIIVFVRSKGNPGVAGFRRVVVGTLAMAGGLILTVSCLGMAVFACFLVVCAAALSGPHH